MSERDKRITRDLMTSDLPYGKRTFSDGTEELFNRRYETIKRRGPGMSTEQVSQEFFYDDKNTPWNSDHVMRQCEAILQIWRQQ